MHFSLASENDFGESIFLKSRFKTFLLKILNYPQFHEHMKLNNHYTAIPYALSVV